MLLAEDRPAGALARLRRAHDGFGDMEAQWERACNALLLADALRATGEGDSTAALTEALAVFERLDSVAEIDLARERLRASIS